MLNPHIYPKGADVRHPVQLASETSPPYWRLREVQAFLAFIKAERSQMITAVAMRGFLGQQKDNRWWRLILLGIETLEEELQGKPAPVTDVIEWLAEWMRDARQEQRGLLLLTAHRAKGLEFDDVVILDGGWQRASPEGDQDAPRRLFYVAMARAKRSLAIVAMQRRHPIVGDNISALLKRNVVGNDNANSDCGLRYQMIDPSMMNLSYVGRLKPDHPAHEALAKLQTGDPIEIVDVKDHWQIRTNSGVTVGRMARSYQPPKGLSFVRGKVMAFIRWRKIDNDEEFRDRLHHETWEVVLPELVFRPN